jgi:hypothetical protein
MVKHRSSQFYKAVLLYQIEAYLCNPIKKGSGEATAPLVMGLPVRSGGGGMRRIRSAEA